MKRKYEKLEDVINKKLSDQDTEFQERVDKLEASIREEKKETRRLEKETESLKDQLLQTENFFRLKEEEFTDLVNLKDRKLKELEMCIKSISEEANGQISKLSEAVSDFNEKINYYKNRESQLVQEYNALKNQFKNTERQNYLDEMERIHSPNMSSIENKKKNSEVYLLDNSKSKTIEQLRGKVKELEEENMVIIIIII